MKVFAKKGRIYKVLLIGDGGVGKTALRERFLGKGFQSSYLATIGADFAIHSLKINDKDIKLQIWDLAGQERFKSVRSGFYSGSLGVLMVFDVARRDSAENLIHWQEELNKNSTNPVNIILIGNKIDLRESHPDAMTKRKGSGLARRLKKNYSFDKLKYIETSAKDNVNVIDAFKNLATDIFERLENK